MKQKNAVETEEAQELLVWVFVLGLIVGPFVTPERV